MTYRNLFDLKFKEKIPTLELERRFPQDKQKISRLALLELPFRLLKSVLKNHGELTQVLKLKKFLLEEKRKAHTPSKTWKASIAQRMLLRRILRIKR